MLRRRLRAVMAATSLFILGGVLGIAAERVLLTPDVGVVDAPQDAQAEMVTSLRRELDLDSEQVAELEAVLARQQAAVTHAWETIRPRLRVAMDTARAEIEALLTPMQREQFRLWLANEHGTSGAMPTPVHRP